MGFNINDIVSFMISPAVSLINNLSDQDMFNDFTGNNSVNNVLKMLRDGDFNNVLNYIFPGVTYGEDGQAYLASGEFIDKILTKYKAQNPDAKDWDINQIFKEYIRGRLVGTESKSILEYSYYDNRAKKFSDYLEGIISKMNSYIHNDGQYNDFMADIEEFDKVLNLANETSTLGNTFLGMNQGLPTSEVDLIKKIRQIKMAVTSREMALGISYNLKYYREHYLGQKLSPTNQKKADEMFQEMVAALSNNGYDSKYITDTLMQALDSGIAGNFDPYRWLNDSNYKQQTIDYYNIIKGTWNIFDIIDKTPQYNRIFKIFSGLVATDRAVSARSNLTHAITQQVNEEQNYLDDNQIKGINKYVYDLFLRNWLRTKQYKFPLLAGQTYLNGYADKVQSKRNTYINISTADGIASFKYLMEEVVIPKLKRGEFDDLEVDNEGQLKVKTSTIKGNAFINGLVRDMDGDMPIYRLDIDMRSINNTPDNIIKFQNYVHGLQQLSSIRINNIPLSDWFMLYNIVTNQNQFGSDRLTTIFKAFLPKANANSIISDFFSYVGNLDWDNIDLDNVEGYDLQDVLLRIAPLISKNGELLAKSKMVKEYDRNLGLIYKVKGRSSYQLFRGDGLVLPKSRISGETNEQRTVRQRNYQEYFTMQMPANDFNEYLKNQFNSSNIDDVIQAIREYTNKAYMEFYKDCK